MISFSKYFGFHLQQVLLNLNHLLMVLFHWIGLHFVFANYRATEIREAKETCMNTKQNAPIFYLKGIIYKR